LLVISPHLDDAVLSCGERLARSPGATVVTVCGGKPRRRTGLTQWDKDSGFNSPDEVMTIRIGEDRAALHLLAARQVVLSERDAQYHPLPGRRRRVTRALHEILEAWDPDECLFPIGIGHPDHILTRNSCLALAKRRPRVTSTVYVDLPYGMSPRFGLATRSAHQAIRAAGFKLDPIRPEPDQTTYDVKQRALACYPSQLRSLTSSRTNFLLPDQVAKEAFFKVTSTDLSPSPRSHQPA
jgi:LmbE family N-acetylglucosaminyl deacetylase